MKRSFIWRVGVGSSPFSWNPKGSRMYKKVEWEKKKFRDEVEGVGLNEP